MIVVYAAGKFLAYSAWCYFGLRSMQPGIASVASAMRLGAVRWLLGLLFGAGVFLAVGSIAAEAAARTYFTVYTPIRAVEWGIMVLLINRSAPQMAVSNRIIPSLGWCAGGILVSFLTDLLSPDGVQGRFCVGRCLC